MDNKDVNPADTEGPAVEKRAKISKMQQQILSIVGGTAVFVGVCAVLIIYFFRMQGFNNRVIAAKDQALQDYSTTIRNVGICQTAGSTTGVLSSEELDKCSPNAYLSENLPGTLRYNVMVTTANDQNLESVARDLQASCYDSDGKVTDFKALYESVDSNDKIENKETMKAYYLDMMKGCSALRAIPDALPAQKNTEALLASLNRLFDVANWQPKGLSPDNSVSETPYEGVNTIPVSLSVEADSKETLLVLSTIEKSIRNYDITGATVEWSGVDTLTLNASARAYYTSEESLTEKTITVYADESKRTSTRTTGGMK